MRKAAINLTFAAAKVKYDIECTIVKFTNEATSSSGAIEPERPPSTHVDNEAATPVLQAKVRITQVLNQSVDQEIPMLSEVQLLALRQH